MITHGSDWSVSQVRDLSQFGKPFDLWPNISSGGKCCLAGNVVWLKMEEFRILKLKRQTSSAFQCYISETFGPMSPSPILTRTTSPDLNTPNLANLRLCLRSYCMRCLATTGCQALRDWCSCSFWPVILPINSLSKFRSSTIHSKALLGLLIGSQLIDFYPFPL